MKMLALAYTAQARYITLDWSVHCQLHSLTPTKQPNQLCVIKDRNCTVSLQTRASRSAVTVFLSNEIRLADSANSKRIRRIKQYSAFASNFLLLGIRLPSHALTRREIPM